MFDAHTAHFQIVVRVAHWKFTAALFRFGCLFFCFVVPFSLHSSLISFGNSNVLNGKLHRILDIDAQQHCSVLCMCCMCVVYAWYDIHNMVLLMLNPFPHTHKYTLYEWVYVPRKFKNHYVSVVNFMSWKRNETNLYTFCLLLAYLLTN